MMKGERDTSTQLPRVFVTFKTPHIYQLRAYVYQGRDMYGSDANGFSGMHGTCHNVHAHVCIFVA